VDWSRSRIFLYAAVILMQRGCILWEFEMRGFEIVLHENIKSHFMHKILNHAGEKLKIKI
jgi:hypothetical protein